MTATWICRATSVVTIGEIEKGATLQRRRGDIEAGRCIEVWLAGIVQRFSRRILDVGLDVIRAWGRLKAARPRPAMDCLIAAIASVHRLSVVTRSAADFGDAGLTVLCPWTEASSKQATGVCGLGGIWSAQCADPRTAYSAQPCLPNL